jgi:hypothetical protein
VLQHANRIVFQVVVNLHLTNAEHFFSRFVYRL